MEVVKKTGNKNEVSCDHKTDIQRIEYLKEDRKSNCAPNTFYAPEVTWLLLFSFIPSPL